MVVYPFLILTAFGPRSLSSISNSTLSPSLRFMSAGTADRWRNISFPASPRTNPYPLRVLYHFIVPFMVFVPPYFGVV